MKTISVILVLTVCGLSEGKEIHSSFPKCKKTSEYLTKCLTETVNKGWPELVKGENGADWSTIKLQPVDEEVVNIFHTKFLNGTLIGLEGAQFTEVGVDFKKKIFTVLFTCPKISVAGNADFQANLFGLSLNDKTPVNATYYGGVYSFRFQYDLIEKGGQEYLKIINSELDYNIDKLNIEFTNPDRSHLARQSKLFNDNWKTVNALSSRPAGKTLAKAFSSIVERLLKDIPFNNLFD